VDKEFYDKQYALVKKYEPPTRDQYERRFADYTTPQFKAILEKIFASAGATKPELYAYTENLNASADELVYDRNYSLIF
jgi:hypothetical protein